MLQNNIYRIIDANLNRASEALRVLEDWSRFVKNNQELSQNLKSLRHELNNFFKPNIVFHRESVTDVGRFNENKTKRNSVRDIIRANSKRFEESIRTLAEYGSLIDLNIKRLEEIRYEMYTLEKELLRNEKLLRLHNASLYLISSSNGFNSRKDFFKVIEEAIEGSIDIIQLREKNSSEKDIIEISKEIQRLINKTDILFIMNDRTDLAIACNADGVHLGQDDLSVIEARKISHDGFIIGLSTHNIEQGIKGKTSGADYLGVGPVFATPTKPDYNPCGLEYVKWASKNLNDIPWFAIGGIDETNAYKVADSGAGRIAVVRAIMKANKPKETSSKLKEIINKNNLVYAKNT
jgi:thiamine-phosphate pyrophosphorylase